MNETIWAIGLVVICAYLLALVIPLHVGAAQFWVSMYTDMKRWRQRRRDKKAGTGLQ